MVRASPTAGTDRRLGAVRRDIRGALLLPVFSVDGLRILLVRIPLRCACDLTDHDE